MLLFGGQSAEHDVSRVSARHVLAAVDTDRFRVDTVAITKAGEWLRADEAAAMLSPGADPEALPDGLQAEGTAIEPLVAMAPASPDEQVVVFPILHGPLGEDGTVQGLLELAGVPYVGCGVLSSALAMDKAIAKEVFAGAGIPQAAFRSFHADDWERDADLAAQLVEQLGLPIFVKPSNMGSSIGVSKAHDLAGLRTAVATALTYDEWVVCEEAVVGREIECSVIGNRRPRASVPGEIEPGAEFYDFEDKYIDGSAKLMIPAPLPPEVTAELQSLAIRAYQALRCEGMARVDVFYEEGGRGFLVNEINTIPGFTPVSMYPQMWAASGLSYSDLITELAEHALERHRRRRRRVD